MNLKQSRKIFTLSLGLTKQGRSLSRRIAEVSRKTREQLMVQGGRKSCWRVYPSSVLQKVTLQADAPETGSVLTKCVDFQQWGWITVAKTCLVCDCSVDVIGGIYRTRCLNFVWFLSGEIGNLLGRGSRGFLGLGFGRICNRRLWYNIVPRSSNLRKSWGHILYKNRYERGNHFSCLYSLVVQTSAEE